MHESRLHTEQGARVAREEEMSFVVRRNDTATSGFYVGRPTVLGNPYAITPERGRDAVCDLYEQWFADNKDRGDVKTLLDDLLRLHRQLHPKHLALLCHCAPERCHADTIAAYLNDELKKDMMV